MNVSLPGPLRQEMERQVAAGAYGSTSEYIREAIRDKLARERERAQAAGVLGALLIQGIESGAPVTFSDRFTPSRKAALRRRLADLGGKEARGVGRKSGKVA